MDPLEENERAVYMKMHKISLITTTYNSKLFLEETIKSVISQNYENLEYIIIDGNSDDGTMEILNAYKEHISVIISEPDNGVYHALQKGFDLATGDIYGWINSDDILLPGALMAINKAFHKIPGCQWLTGIPSNITIDGIVFNAIQAHVYRRYENFEYLNSKPYAIQQESTFFSSELYRISGGISRHYKLAGDYDLWARFFYHKARPILINSNIGAFRSRPNQLSSDKRLYLDEVNEIRKKYNTPAMRANYLLYRLSHFLIKFLPWIIAKKFMGPRCVYFYTKQGTLTKLTNRQFI